MLFETSWANHEFRCSSVARVLISRFDSDLRVEVQGNGKGHRHPKRSEMKLTGKARVGIRGCEKGFAN